MFEGEGRTRSQKGWSQTSHIAHQQSWNHCLEMDQTTWRSPACRYGKGSRNRLNNYGHRTDSSLHVAFM